MLPYNLGTKIKTKMAICLKIQSWVGFSLTFYMEIVNPSRWVNPGLKRVTQQEELTRLDYFVYVNTYKHLTAEGLTLCSDSTWDRVKRPYVSQTVKTLSEYNFSSGKALYWFQYMLCTSIYTFIKESGL